MPNFVANQSMTDTRKIIQALAYVASKQQGAAIDNLKAFKLLWLADRYHLRQYGRTVTGDTYFAMPKGIVPSDAKHLLEHRKTMLRPAESPAEETITPHTGYYVLTGKLNTRVFSKTDMTALDKVTELYNGMTGEELSNLSHGFPEWERYRSRIESAGHKSSFKVDMRLFFVNHDDGKGLFMDDSGLLSVTESVYLSHHGA